MIIDVTDNTFEAEVLKSDTPMVVDFWADWCGPCKQLMPIMEEICKELHGKVKVVKLNIDQNPNIPTTYSIRSIPTLIIFYHGKVIATRIGGAPKSSIIKWIDESLLEAKA